MCIQAASLAGLLSPPLKRNARSKVDDEMKGKGRQVREGGDREGGKSLIIKRKVNVKKNRESDGKKERKGKGG